VNVAPRIRDAHRYSRIFNGRRELSDHILVSHALLAGGNKVDTGVQNRPSSTNDPKTNDAAPRPAAP
jgi:hypothetical protein